MCHRCWEIRHWVDECGDRISSWISINATESKGLLTELDRLTRIRCEEARGAKEAYLAFWHKECWEFEGSEGSCFVDDGPQNLSLSTNLVLFGYAAHLYVARSVNVEEVSLVV